MNGRLYSAGAFAARLSVSVRTLRYYDQIGILSPASHSKSGYRLYSEADATRLQHILALKFLGFSLDQIRACLRTGPVDLPARLAAQRAMMSEKLGHIEAVIRAIGLAEEALARGSSIWDSLVEIVEVMQVQQKDEWQAKYFTPEQRTRMDELSEASYGDEARRQLAARPPWTEEEQRKVDEQYALIASKLKRLVSAGADPGCEDAQAVARLQAELIAAFTQGSAAVADGLEHWWTRYEGMPREQQPFQPPYSGKEAEFLGEASRIYRDRAKP